VKRSMFAICFSVVAVAGCEPETIIYTADPACESNEDCPDGVCVRGECVDGECTKDADCVPLPPTCSSSDTMMLRPTGTCDVEYHCIYEPVYEGCEHGCDFDSGQCAAAPCDGVVCQTPPNECFFADGTCVEGACHYDLRNGVTCDDSDACTLGDTCDEGVCLGTPMTCDGAPQDVCDSTSAARVYQDQGVCRDGACEYPYDIQTCSYGCDSGACQGNPCGAGSCDSPPADYCVDADHARVHQAIGSCLLGNCDYQFVDEYCPHGCDLGACQPDPCGGVVCETPPDPICVDTNRRLSYALYGSCDAGQCRYLGGESNCAFGCVDGFCAGDPCAGTNCDDNNPCTDDWCDSAAGGACRHDGVSDARACTSASGKCPSGTCAGSTCVPTSGISCVTEVDVDICHDVEVEGVCTGSGECVVQSVPPQYSCPDCNGLCIQCYIIQVCVPLF